MAIEVLLVECKACGRRSALTRKHGLPIFQGSMKEVRDVKFRCSNQGCGSSETRTYIPHSEDEVTMWLAGDPLPEDRRVS